MIQLTFSIPGVEVRRKLCSRQWTQEEGGGGGIIDTLIVHNQYSQRAKVGHPLAKATQQTWLLGTGFLAVNFF